jgi:hypothetical protein
LREREREGGGGGSERHYISGGRDGNIIFCLKVPIQCPLVFLIRVRIILKLLKLEVQTVPVYCEIHMEHANTVRTSQETRYFSATDTNLLTLFRETLAVCCENHTEHTNTIRTSQETHYFSATDTNRLMLFRETLAVCCEDHTEHTNALCGQKRDTSSNHWGFTGLIVSIVILCSAEIM